MKRVNATLSYMQLLKLFRGKEKTTGKEFSQEHWFSFLGLYMMATMNILARAKSFVLLGSLSVRTSKKDAKSHEGAIHFHFQRVGSSDVIVCT